MNKGLFNSVLVFSLMIILVFFITAQENSTSENQSSLISESLGEGQQNLLNSSLNDSGYFEINSLVEEENITSTSQNSENFSGTISNQEKKEEDLLPLLNNTINESDNNSNLKLNDSSTNIENYVTKNSGGQGNAEYIELTQENFEEGVSFEDSLVEDSSPSFEDVTYTSLQVQGKKEIDIGDYEGMKITKEELEKSEVEKEVILSSEEHYEGYLRVYTSLTQESETNEIKIFWKNKEDLEITNLPEFEVEYYDENENGLIDRVSWRVPHLSEQIFRVVVEINYFNESQENLLLDVFGPSGTVRNPILFNISVNYSKEFNCSLEVGGIWEENFNLNKEYNINLPNGNYNWGVVCIDPLNNSIINTSLGAFSINEEFSCSLQEGKTYFLDLIENKIKNPETILVNSSYPSNFSVQIIKNGNEVVYTKSYLNSASISMDESILNSAGNYVLKATFNESAPNYVILTNFSVVSANIVLNTTSIEEGKSVKITVNVNSPNKVIQTIILDYGDGTNDYRTPNSNIFSGEFTKKYVQEGTYSPILVVTIPGENTFNITKNGLTVTENENPEDDDPPSITLYNPEHKEVFNEEVINFSYKASDNIKIQNCTFKLYENCASLTTCSTSETNLVFPVNSQQRAIANNFSVQNNKEVEIKLQDFEDGIYLWEIECYDNSSNHDSEWNIFQIAVNGTSVQVSLDYDHKQEVEELKELADNFLSFEFDLEEQEVLEGLNLLNDAKYYKKRLLDIQDFFQENYKYVSSEELKEKKTEEYLEELEKIKNSIPISIDVQENYEYIKNSVEKEFQEIVEEYFYSSNTQLSKSSMRKLQEINKEIQNELSVSVKVKKVAIEYQNGTQEMVFVKKKVEINDDSYDKILEIIPKEVVENSEDIVFITEKINIGDNNMFEMEYDNLENKEIVYYLNGPVKVKDLEKTETVLFEDDLNKFEAKVTGFFVFGGISSDFAIYFALAFILAIILIVLVPTVLKKFKMIGWKKEPNVVKVIDLIEEINKFLKEKEVEKARENYYKIKEIYPVLPYKTKPYFYKKINEVLVRIDKKDIFGLVKEYQEAKRRWDKENLMRLYEDIKKIYKRLPEKDRKKVYDIINGY